MPRCNDGFCASVVRMVVMVMITSLYFLLVVGRAVVCELKTWSLVDGWLNGGHYDDVNGVLDGEDGDTFSFIGSLLR